MTGSGYAKMPLTSFQWTSVSRKLRPWYWYVSRIVVDPQQVQHRGVQVVDMHRVLSRC